MIYKKDKDVLSINLDKRSGVMHISSAKGIDGGTYAIIIILVE